MDPVDLYGTLQKRPRLHCRTMRCPCGASKHFRCSGPTERRQTTVKIEFHAPIAAPHKAHKSPRSSNLHAYGETVMAAVAAGLKDAKRGRFATYAKAQAAALAVSEFPFHAQDLRSG